MRRILAIFRKDARHLWPQAAALILLMGAAALFDPTYRGGVSAYYDLLPSFALPLVCWLIIISAIHQEKLTGDRQYWLTRPYSRRELLIAKLLLVAVFINLPLLIYHAGVYSALGISPANHLGALLWRQVFFTAFYVLPAIAIASVTRSVSQVLAISLASAGSVWILGQVHFLRHPSPASTPDVPGSVLPAALLAAGSSAVVALAYARRTKLAGAIAAAVALTFVADPLWRPSSPTVHGAPARLSLDTDPSRQRTPATGGGPDMRTEIPVRLDGAPSGFGFDRRYFNLELTGRGRIDSYPAELHDVQNGRAWLSLWFLGGDLTVTLRGTFELQLFDVPSSLPLPRQSVVSVPDVGACRDTRDPRGSISFTCYSASPRAVVIAGAENRVNWIVSAASVEGPVPIESGFQPVRRFTSMVSYAGWDQTRGLKLIAARPLPPLQVTLEFPSLDLGKYQVMGHQ